MITDIKEIPNNSSLYIYGTGSAGKSLLAWILKCRKDIKVLGFIDSYKSGKLLEIPIIKFKLFLKKLHPGSYDLILIASAAHKSIEKTLGNKGLSKFNTISVPSYLMSYILYPEKKYLFLRSLIHIYGKLKKSGIHLFFGEHRGKFIGNNKYFYLYLKNRFKTDVYWVTNDKNLYSELKSEGIDVLDFGTKGFYKYLFRASFFYFDNMNWQRELPWLQFFKTKKIHMSHGVGLKMTEKMQIPEEFLTSLTQMEKQRLEKKIFKNDLLISTSEFYAKNVSYPAYGTPMRDIILSGYPKNDLFYRDMPGENIFSDKSVLKKIDQFIEKKYKIIVYAPTFRDMDINFKYSNLIKFTELNDFLLQNKLILVFKGHTSYNESGLQSLKKASNILIYDNVKDGYPLLKRSELLITDYSSIFMDYLHHKKPVIFFNYDYEEYMEQHRALQFDYFKMTPGPKAANLSQLKKWILYFLVEKKDEYKKVRDEIFDLAFKYVDGSSSERIYNIIKEKFY